MFLIVYWLCVFGLSENNGNLSEWMRGVERHCFVLCDKHSHCHEKLVIFQSNLLAASAKDGKASLQPFYKIQFLWTLSHSTDSIGRMENIQCIKDTREVENASEMRDNCTFYRATLSAIFVLLVFQFCFHFRRMHKFSLCNCFRHGSSIWKKIYLERRAIKLPSIFYTNGMQLLSLSTKTASISKVIAD